MPYLVLLVLGLTCVPDELPKPPSWLPPWGSVLLAGASVVVLRLLANVAVRRFCRKLRRDPLQSDRIVRQYLRFRRFHTFVLVGMYLGLLFLGGWGRTVKDFLTFETWAFPGTELLVLLPFWVSLFLSWSRFYDVELTLQTVVRGDDRDPPPGRWAYVGLQARQSLMLAVPPMVLLFALQLCLEFIPGVKDNQYLTPVMTGSLLAALFIGQGLLLRLLLNLKPLPPGELRDRLEAQARRLDFRFANILVWHTHNNIGTALLTGPLPLFRYVVLTDRLMENMDVDEIEGVFAHEVGHVKYRHMVFYLVFLFGSLVLLSALGGMLLDSLDRILPKEAIAAFAHEHLPWPDYWLASLGWVLAVGLGLVMLGYIFVVFGWLSRMCERQADLYACQHVSYSSFLSALERVALMNGMKRTRWTWRHGSIAQRVNFLEGVLRNPRAASRYHRDTAKVRWSLLVILVFVFIGLGPKPVMELLRPVTPSSENGKPLER
ncbi:MAG: M48 family metallopeptidase [Gemmataceae bacterium]